MTLNAVVNTLGQDLLRRYGERVHKLALDVGFTCPNRDGSKGTGGCTFCNNSSFSPNGRRPVPLAEQIDAGRRVIAKRTRAKLFLAYFQAYTNTYDSPARLRAWYDEALAQDGVIGLAIGTRPDCVPDAVLDLLAEYRAQGHEIWLELGVQSSFDGSLARVNRGHGFAEYQDAVQRAHARKLPVCAHMIVGLPGEQPWHARITLTRLLSQGVEGLKLHPLHVVKGTLLANEWRRGEYRAWTLDEYIQVAADLIELTPPEVVFHRLTGSASAALLLAPGWCQYKWRVLNGIEQELRRRGTCHGAQQEGRLCLQ